MHRPRRVVERTTAHQSIQTCFFSRRASSSAFFMLAAITFCEVAPETLGRALTKLSTASSSCCIKELNAPLPAAFDRILCTVSS